MVNHNNQKKIALINDYSGFGRCSVAVQLPVISTMGVQCCPVPTSIFSNHTGFPDFFYTDYTEHMQEYVDQWKKLHLEFRGICTGFLGSREQIDIVNQFIKDFKTEDTIVVVDPVMGDYGKLYPTITDEMARGLKHIVKKADIVTPNLTEACYLTQTPYKEKWKIAELAELAEKVSELGAKKVVITGIPQKTFLCNLCYDRTHGEPVITTIKTHKIGTSRSGTGDIFASIVAADAVNGVEFGTSVRKASRFIKTCIQKAIDMDIPVTDGVPFEEVLYKLRNKKEK